MSIQYMRPRARHAEYYVEYSLVDLLIALAPCSSRTSRCLGAPCRWRPVSSVWCPHVGLWSR